MNHYIPVHSKEIIVDENGSSAVSSSHHHNNSTDQVAETKSPSSIERLSTDDAPQPSIRVQNVFPVSKWTYLYASCAALNSVNLGYDLGVSTNVGPLLLKEFDLTTEQLEVFLGSLNFWSIVGAIISPILSDRYGRRTTLRWAALGFLVGVVVCACAANFSTLMVGRMIVGIGVGVGEAIDPMYIAEITPAHIRGELVSWAEAGVAVGVVLGFASNLFGVGWRIMVALGVVLPVCMVVLSTWVLPESPRWLVAHHHEPVARAILQRIYPTEALVDKVLCEMKRSLELEHVANKLVGWQALLRPTPAVRRTLVVGVGIACIQQAVGIDSVMFYLMFVLDESGIKSKLGQDLALIALGTVKLAFVFVGARYFDHTGRRPMLFLSLGGMAIALLVVSFTFTKVASSTMDIVTVSALASYLAFFSVGLGPGNWVVVSEIFAPSIRAKAMMLAVVPNRITATIMASTFLSVAQAITWSGFFLLLACICLVSMIFLYVYLPETKGRTLEEMVRYFAEVTGDWSILEMEQSIRHPRGHSELELNNQDSHQVNCHTNQRLRYHQEPKGKGLHDDASFKNVVAIS